MSSTQVSIFSIAFKENNLRGVSKKENGHLAWQVLMYPLRYETGLSVHVQNKAGKYM
jgi:hypothetical protein